MPHIVHLETGRYLYGGAQQVRMLLNGLVDEGMECTLVCPPDSEISTAVAGAVHVHTMPMAGDLDAAFAYRFGKWLKSQSVDLVHVHSRRGADMWGGMGARWAGVTPLLSRRVDNPEPAIMAGMKYRRYERIIAISSAIEKVLLDAGVPASKLRVVRSAIDAQACQPTWQRPDFMAAFDLEPAHLSCVCVSQLIARKGHDVLLEAWGEVRSAVPTARLLLFGRGPDEEKIKKTVKESEHSDTIRLIGFREDLRNYLGFADLLVHAATSEGLGVALLEAQAAGVPVVAARAGGVPEASADERSGVLVPPDSPAELAQAMIRLLRDVELRQRLGAGGREHVANAFSPAEMVSGNLAVYRELLNQASDER